jgi:hypothetical protein
MYSLSRILSNFIGLNFDNLLLIIEKHNMFIVCTEVK